MVLLVGRHHQVGQALSDAIEEETTVFALGRLGGLGEFLEKKRQFVSPISTERTNLILASPTFGKTSSRTTPPTIGAG
jgi:hypothetical protein